MNDILVKEAQDVLAHLDNKTLFKQAFDERIPGLIKTVVKEESFVGKILNYRNVDINSDGVQRRIDGVDGIYVIKEVESNAIGFATSFRSGVKPHYPDTKIFAMDIGKIRTERFRKPYMELKVATNLVKMLQENGINYLARIQDAKLLESSLRAASAYTQWAIPHHIHADWSAGVDKNDFVHLKNIFAYHELLPAKIVMSHVLSNTLSKTVSLTYGEVAAKMYHEGVTNTNFDGLPFLASIKTNLGGGEAEYKFTKYSTATNPGTDRITVGAVANGVQQVSDNVGTAVETMIHNGVLSIGDEVVVGDTNIGIVVAIDAANNVFSMRVSQGTIGAADNVQWVLRSNGRLFDFILPVGNYEQSGWKYSRLYSYTAPEFLGDFIQFDSDQSETKWDEDKFEWTNWRYIGMGFGDIRGIACMTVRVQ